MCYADFVAKAKPKNQAAALMAKLRWKGISKKERSRIMTGVVQAREAKRRAEKTLDLRGSGRVL